jgi:hypothetical protein
VSWPFEFSPFEAARLSPASQARTLRFFFFWNFLGKERKKAAKATTSDAFEMESDLGRAMKQKDIVFSGYWGPKWTKR